MAGSYWVETLGCPKNQVDSDKLTGTILADGLVPARRPEDADLIVVNTCAFIEEARQESVDTILDLADRRREGSRLVVTGCLAERYGSELADVLPEADLVAGFGVPVTLGARPRRQADTAGLDLLELPRPPASAPWAYVKVAEGCDRACGFCAIPSFRGRQRSRPVSSILGEVDALGVSEVVLVAQDLASYGRDVGRPGAIHELVAAVAERVARVRLLYLYPSELTDRLVDTVLATGVPYFDLSLQHVSRPLLRRMRRWGEGARFLERIASIRRREPDAAFRSSFIVGYPGETEEDHDALLTFIEEAQLDWAGFFAYSEEEGTYAAGLEPKVDRGLALERLSELGQAQDLITTSRRAHLVGRPLEVLVDAPGRARSHREAPEIDGIVRVPRHLPTGSLAQVVAVAVTGPDLEALAVEAA
ncbi:MAG TPA: 30S ribosomal protein S12 methylthiotransferase RimO [Acidimicrobiales bacterium]|nr:30S ribosomal protein S12 methylthiotransferase RimO [Acidimicrobiales bacterium]